MAKYIVTSGANFTPFTYDELVKPLAQMTEAHQQAQASYDELATTTAQLERYLDDNPDDDYARGIYNGYMNRLQTLQDNLYRNGFSQNTARDLSLARTAYHHDIVPMTEAVGRRRKWSDAYKQMQIEHPEMILGKDPASYNIRDYMEDTNFGGFRTYSTSQLAKDTSAAAAAAAKALAPRPRTWDTSSRVPAGYAETEMTTGYTAAEVDKAMDAFRKGLDTTDNARANELLAIAKDVYGSSGIADWQNESPGAFDRAAQAIGEGMRSAIGETKYELIQRRDGIYSPAYAASLKNKTTKDKETKTNTYWQPGPDEFVGNGRRDYDKDLKWLQANMKNGTLQGSNESAYDKALADYKGKASSLVGAPARRGVTNTAELNKLNRLYDEYGLTGDERTPENLSNAIVSEQNRTMRRVNPIQIRQTSGVNMGEEIRGRLGVNAVDTSKDVLDTYFHEHNSSTPISKKDKIFKILADKNTTYYITQHPDHKGSIYANSGEHGAMDIDAKGFGSIPVSREELYSYIAPFYDAAKNAPDRATAETAATLVDSFFNTYPQLYLNNGGAVYMDYIISHFPELSASVTGMPGGNALMKAVLDYITTYSFEWPNTRPQTQGDDGSEYRWK